MTRAELDQEMLALLRALELCSHAPAGPYEPVGRSRSSERPAGPPGDLGPEHYRRAYGPPFHICTTGCRHRRPPARTDYQRFHVIQEARAELRQLHGRAHGPQVKGETEAQRVQRMLDETRGMTPEAVSTTSFRMSATIVRRHRRAAGLDPETGKAFEEEQLDAEKRRRRVQELAAQGYSDTYIARKVGVHRSTVERDLGKRAA